MNTPRRNRGFIAEFIGFLSHEKKWWLLPLVLVFAAIGALALVAEVYPAAAPFIYSFF